MEPPRQPLAAFVHISAARSATPPCPRSRPEPSRASPRAARCSSARRAVVSRASRAPSTSQPRVTALPRESPSRRTTRASTTPARSSTGRVRTRVAPRFPRSSRTRARTSSRRPPPSPRLSSSWTLFTYRSYLCIPARRLPRHRSVLSRAETRRPRRRGGQVHAHARR